MAELKIVIAEDNPLMMELLSSILEEEDGFVVREVPQKKLKAQTSIFL